ncbi:heme exporter protein CcmD [Actinobacillus pleuropneumoniae]|uniref:heme exporter protein CcmD n=1 Tax=Actinobacillus pleuropneumoniae TaxID=715 RepID=UPI003D02FEB0
MQFQFESISEFFSMGNYGFYVWLSYAVSLLTMGILIWQTQREHKQILQNIKKEQARETQLNKQAR